MNSFTEFITNNQNYVQENGELCKCKLPKYPRKRLAILTCMDTRLTVQLEKCLGLERGDAIVLKTAGNTMKGQELRSLIAAIYTLKVERVMVIGHPDCGMANIDTQALTEIMISRGTDPRDIEKLGDLNQWFGGFEDSEQNIIDTVNYIRRHPLIPRDVPVAGFLFDQDTSELQPLVYPVPTVHHSAFADYFRAENRANTGA